MLSCKNIPQSNSDMDSSALCSYTLLDDSIMIEDSATDVRENHNLISPPPSKIPMSELGHQNVDDEVVEIEIWTCKACTFINYGRNDAGTCEMCETASSLP